MICENGKLVIKESQGLCEYEKWAAFSCNPLKIEDIFLIPINVWRTGKNGGLLLYQISYVLQRGHRGSGNRPSSERFSVPVHIRSELWRYRV